MQIGQKIQQLRRGKNLSQEELAEVLGVSRQAVSKWESGAATPELEKIIELSRFFDCSVDELLQEEPPQREETPEAAPRGRGHGWVILLCVGLGLTLVIGAVYAKERMERLTERLNRLEQQMSQVDDTIQVSLYSLKKEITESLQKQYDLVADAQTELIDLSPLQGTAVMRVRVTPRSDTETMQVQFVLTGEGMESKRFPAEKNEDLSYEAALTVPLSEQPLGLSVVIEEDGVRSIQVLEPISPLRGLAFLQPERAAFVGRSSWMSGSDKVALSGSVEASVRDSAYNRVKTGKAVLYRNGIAIGEYPLHDGGQSEYVYSAAPTGVYGVVRYETDALQEQIRIAPGDVITLEMILEDSFGITYRTPVHRIIVDADGKAEVQRPENVETEIIFP